MFFFIYFFFIFLLTQEILIQFCLPFIILVTFFQSVTPSLKREGFPCIPDTTWSHIGGHENIKKTLKELIIEPILEPALHKRFEMKQKSGEWGAGFLKLVILMYISFYLFIYHHFAAPYSSLINISSTIVTVQYLGTTRISVVKVLCW